MMSYYLSPSRRRHMARRWDVSRSEVHIPVDVVADGEEFVLSAFVPGIEADSLEIEVLEDTVTIQGEFSEMEQEGLRYLLRERPQGRFMRRLRLPADLEANQAEAEVSNGVLELRIPKTESAKTKKIAVKVK